MVGGSFEMEVWDEDFLDELLQAEELALSTQRPSHAPPPPPPFNPPPPPPREVSYSPPRVLSQRTIETRDTVAVPDSIVTHVDREEENDRLKKELHGVSQHLHHLEEEIVELRKERDKKEELLKDLHSKIEARDAEFQHTKNVEIPADPGTSKVYQEPSPSNDQLGSSGICSSNKLYSLWNSTDEKQGRDLVAKLFMTCEADFHMLFGYLNSQKDSSKDTQSVETAKVSQLYAVLNKLQISYDTLRLRDLLGALADLCSLKNVVIVRSSVRILRNVLGSSLSMEKEYGKRENVIVEEHSSKANSSDTNGSGDPENESMCFTNLAEMLKQGQILSGLELPNINTAGHTGFFDHTLETSISTVFWVSLFETMCLVATENNEEQIQREAVSIMNLILMRQNAYLDRDKFAGELAFRSLPKLLRREAGFYVQDQAVHTLYLLCNCPEVIPMFCSGIEEDRKRACAEDTKDTNSSTFHWLNEVLIGLADCVACYGSTSAEEMKLRKNAITVLAFIGSAGKSAFEILLSHKLPKGTNFFAIILQSLTSDLDPRLLNSAKQSGIVKEQCLLIREALIFLNRLVSHSDYSVPVLQALTNTREMASTTVDVANRLTQNSGLLWKDISSKKHVRESEIADLARVFKKRVFTFLGDSIS